MYCVTVYITYYKQADPGVGDQSSKWGQGGLYYLSQLGQQDPYFLLVLRIIILIIIAFYISSICISYFLSLRIIFLIRYIMNLPGRFKGFYNYLSQPGA